MVKLFSSLHKYKFLNKKFILIEQFLQQIDIQLRKFA